MTSNITKKEKVKVTLPNGTQLETDRLSIGLEPVIPFKIFSSDFDIGGGVHVTALRDFGKEKKKGIAASEAYYTLSEVTEKERTEALKDHVERLVAAWKGGVIPHPASATQEYEMGQRYYKTLMKLARR